MAFYLLVWTYFNDVNVGRNILMNSELKECFLGAVTRKNETKLRKTEKNMEKNNTDESYFSENEITI